MDSGSEGSFSGFSDTGSDGDIRNNIHLFNLDNVSDPSSVNSSDLDDSSDDVDDTSDDESDANDDPANLQFTDQLTDVVLRPFVEFSGVRHRLDVDSASEKDYFDILFTQNLMNTLVMETNRYADRGINNQMNIAQPDTAWVPVTVEEVRAYLGMVLLMGIHKLPRLRYYWSADSFLGTYFSVCLCVCLSVTCSKQK